MLSLGIRAGSVERGGAVRESRKIPTPPLARSNVQAKQRIMALGRTL